VTSASNDLTFDSVEPSVDTSIPRTSKLRLKENKYYFNNSIIVICTGSYETHTFFYKKISGKEIFNNVFTTSANSSILQFFIFHTFYAI
jgi:hypothetical protein